MVSVRPDICYAVGYLRRFQQKPGTATLGSIETRVEIFEEYNSVRNQRNDKSPKLLMLIGHQIPTCRPIVFWPHFNDLFRDVDVIRRLYRTTDAIS